ncbi:actinobacterial surface-anchored protein domain protein [Cutibacterium granulosum DSM 20700]|nr:actinobacterial surface-anchored protein domain protein [Cutibacterium granulosum DSM 20700]
MTKKHRPLAARCAAALSALTLALSGGLAPAPAQASGGTPPPDPALKQTVTEDEQVAQGPAEITRGHVDVGPRLIDGKFVLLARDDSANPPVWRSTDDAVLRVVDASRIDVPNDDAYSFLGGMRGRKAYVIPQTQDQKVVWLGWNTQAPEIVKNFPRGAELVFTGHEGPGEAHMFIENGFEAPMSLYDSTKSEQQPVHMEANTHVHANWVFSEPGAQTISMEVCGTDAKGVKHSYPTKLRFVIGDKGSAQDARSMGASASATIADSTAASSDASHGSSSHGAIIAIIAGVVIVAIVVAALIGRSRSRAMRDEVWQDGGASKGNGANPHE